MTFDIYEAKKIVEQNYNKAKANLNKSLTELKKFYDAISDVIPGYSAKQMDYGDFLEDNFTALFIDIRNSTKRALHIGPEKTFLSLHAFFPGMAYTIESYNGYVIDFMGDGLMALFGGKRSGIAKSLAIKQAGLCGLKLLEVLDTVINPLLDKDHIWKLSCGVGLDHGPVIVTKIGTNISYDVKAIGDCINMASKYSKGDNKVIVSKKIKDEWPSSKGGKIRFTKTKVDNDNYGFILSRSI